MMELFLIQGKCKVVVLIALGFHRPLRPEEEHSLLWASIRSFSPIVDQTFYDNVLGFVGNTHSKTRQMTMRAKLQSVTVLEPV